jgi:Xaa-Pro aminopeptidase
MNETKLNLFLAEQKVKNIFKTVENKGLIVSGKTEKQLCDEIILIAKNEFGVEDHWGKKNVRTGINTLEPYIADPQDLMIQENDILFLDFHPIVEGWEADLGRTFVLGNDPLKLKIKKDVEDAWYEANTWYFKQDKLSGAQYFNYAIELAKRYGYEFGNDISGHVVDKYPHEQPGNLSLNVHPDNHDDILQLDKHGNKRYWMLELHFGDRKNNIGAFFEQLLTEE